MEMQQTTPSSLTEGLFVLNGLTAIVKHQSSWTSANLKSCPAGQVDLLGQPMFQGYKVRY